MQPITQLVINTIIDTINIDKAPVVEIPKFPTDKNGLINVYWLTAYGRTYAVGSFLSANTTPQEYVYPKTYTSPNEWNHVLASNREEAIIRTREHAYRIIPMFGPTDFLERELEHFPHIIAMSTLWFDTPNLNQKKLAERSISSIKSRFTDPVGFVEERNDKFYNLLDEVIKKADKSTLVIVSKGMPELNNNTEAEFNFKFLYEKIAFEKPNVVIMDSNMYSLLDKPTDVKEPTIFDQCITTSCIYGIDKILKNR
ncbi:MAG: hypothetical protein ACP5N1_03040 [Candidatus Woesearchaeota archaeon]